MAWVDAPAGWVDSHCHLDMVEGSPEATVAAAGAEGVTHMVTVGTDIESSRSQVALARRLPGVVATVGIHPNDSSGYGPAEEAALEELAGAPEVVGIGEAGLDFYRQGASREDQERSFRSQIRLAKKLGLALVVHSRDAQADTKRVLADARPPGKLMMHCFSGDENDAADYLDMGAALSFAGTVTFRNAAGIQRAAARCPLDRMLIETDSPFLSPHSLRGTPNSPARIPLIGAFLAELKGVAVPDLVTAIASTSRVFWTA